MIEEDQVLSIKQFLLEQNPSKISSHGIFDQFVSKFLSLFETIRYQTEGMNDSLRLLIIDTLYIWLLRTTQCLECKKIDTTQYMLKLQNELLTTENCEITFQYVIDFWTDGTTAFTNALREMFTKLLRLLKVVYAARDRTALFNSWLNQILGISSTLRVQYYLIDYLALETDLSLVLQSKPDFIDTSLSLMWSDSLSNPIGRCITSLLINIYKINFAQDSSRLNQWLDLWQAPTLSRLNDVKYAKAIELYILTPLFRDMPNMAFLKFIQRCSSCDASLLIPLFRIGQELAIEEEPYHENKLISPSTIENLLQQDEHKLDAFELLTFSLKTSKPVHSYIFDIVKRNLRIFFVDTRIQTRNYFCSSLKHFILRIRDSAYSLNRDRNKLIKAKKFPEEQAEKLHHIKLSEEFLKWLLAFLKTQICPGTQYQRNTLALRVLLVLLESGVDDTVPEKYLDLRNYRKYPFSIRFFEDRVLLRLLIDSLTSNYGDIRQMAKKLLVISFHNKTSAALYKELEWSKIHQQATKYMEIYQNTDVGAALLDFLFLTSSNKMGLIQNLLDELQKKIDESKNDYLKHHNDPVSGYFAALSLLLKNEEFSYQPYDDIISRCLSLIISNWDAVKEPVCCNPTDVKTSEEYLKDGIKDQFLVAKAFRSIKESSALLEVLMTRPNVNFEHLTSAGDLLICQLFNLRHSGAFQSVLPSFSSCCTRCFEKYPEQLEKWLLIILDSLEVKTQMITRRSGGIPYLLTSILAAERGKERPLLKLAFEKLERVASLPISQHQDEVDLPQINAFNCIRSIFIESKLAEPCAPYVASALNLSLKNFISDIWALRNCSIMLFTSLQNRIFGKAGKNVSARLFFTRYDGVQDILLNVLQESLKRPFSHEINIAFSQSRVESIFLVLNLLLRLRPTPGYSGLELFAREVSLCLESEHWKIREMAAKTMASLIDDAHAECVTLLDDISTKRQNKLHGHLLAVKSILEDNKYLTQDRDALGGLVLLLLAKRREFVTLNLCFATAKAYIEVLELVIGSENFKISDPDRNNLLSCLGPFFVSHNESYSPDGMKQLCLGVTLKVLFKYENPENIRELCQLGIISSLREVQKVAVQYVTHKIDLTLPDNKDILIQLKESFIEDKVTSSLKALELRVLQGTNETFSVGTVTDLILNPNNEELQLVAIETLGSVVSPNDTKIMDSVLAKYTQDDMPTDFRMASLKCVSNFLKKHAQPRMLLRVHKMLNDDDEELREQAAEFLNKFFSRNFSHSMSPSVIAAKFGTVFIEKFSDLPEAADDIVQNLKEFWDSYDICISVNTRIEGLFEVEKDNQFKNDIEETIQYINILKRSRFHSNEFACWVDCCVERVMSFLRDVRVTDGPLGWASNSEVFSRLCILWNLANIYVPSKAPELEKLLKDRKVHPLIFQYLFIDF